MIRFLLSSLPYTASRKACQRCCKQNLTITPEITHYCAQHATDGMVNVCSRKCRTERCGKKPSFGVADTKKEEYCEQHAWDGMVNICCRKCRTKGCGKKPSFRVAGTKTGDYCAQHALEGLVNV